MIFNGPYKIPAFAFFRFLKAWLLFMICIIRMDAQTTSDGQLWIDTELNYTYKQRYLFQNELSYQTLLSGENYWYSLNMSPALEYNINSHFDLVSSIPLSYTRQNHTMNTFEIRAMLGTRIYFFPQERLQTRLLVRWEERWLYDNSDDNWDVGNRLRMRGEFLYPINKKSYFEDKTWYGIADAEMFVSTSSDIDERFANRFRIRAGVGYRLSYRLRFEGIYLCQFSRNTINDKFDSVSSVLRLRIKYYFQ